MAEVMVNTVELDELVTDMNRAVKALSAIIAEFDQLTGSATPQWTGRSAEAFAVAYGAWRERAVTVLARLAAGARVAEYALTSYRETELGLTRRWM